MTEENKSCSSSSCCACICHNFNGILITLIGVTFLLGAPLGILSPRIVEMTWPILLILLGLKNSIGKGKCKCCSNS